MRLRGMERVFDVSRQTVLKWVECLPPLIETLLPAAPNDVLEVDEAWSFVTKTVDLRDVAACIDLLSAILAGPLREFHQG